MESTSLDPCVTPDRHDSVDIFGPRERPRKAMHGIGFIPDIWVNKAREAGIFPTPRSFIAATIIARAADIDGRWCFIHLDTLVSRSGGLLSRTVVTRAIGDLIDAGLLRKLDHRQALGFFAGDLARRSRTLDRLPLVLELLIPAEDFPDSVREEINAVRASLGEEPLEEVTRPRLRRAATGRSDPGDRSDRPTHLYPIHLPSDEPPCSVRGSSGTGRETPPTPADGPHRRISRIPDRLLLDPAADRAALGRAVDALARRGLDTAALTALFRGVEHLARPYPALMSRLRDLEAAHTFLDGSLGRGVTVLGQSIVPRPRVAGDDLDAFARAPEFDVDERGAATRTCPDHPGVRNVPGGACRVCASPCRSVPGEILHPPPEPRVPVPGGGGEGTFGVEPTRTERILASLMAGKATVDEPVPKTEPAHPPARQAIIDGIRQRLAA